MHGPSCGISPARPDHCLKQGGQRSKTLAAHLDVTAVSETTFAYAVCKAHVVPWLMSRVGLGGKSFQTGLWGEALLIFDIWASMGDFAPTWLMKI